LLGRPTVRALGLGLLLVSLLAGGPPAAGAAIQVHGSWTGTVRESGSGHFLGHGRTQPTTLVLATKGKKLRLQATAHDFPRPGQRVRYDLQGFIVGERFDRRGRQVVTVIFGRHKSPPLAAKGLLRVARGPGALEIARYRDGSLRVRDANGTHGRLRLDETSLAGLSGAAD
jgi:hypothetical protein